MLLQPSLLGPVLVVSQHFSTVSRVFFDRCVSVEPPVVNNACAALALAHRRRVERRELLPRAPVLRVSGVTCCRCALSFSRVLIFTDSRRSFSSFLPHLDVLPIVLGGWLTSKLAVRRCLRMLQLARNLRQCENCKLSMSTAILPFTFVDCFSGAPAPDFTGPSSSADWRMDLPGQVGTSVLYAPTSS